MNKRLREKLTDEVRLSSTEMAELDRALEAESVRPLIAALPDEEPSLEWRSRLNERLWETRPKRLRQPWVFAGTMIGATACAIAAMMMVIGNPQVAKPEPVAVQSSVERNILVAHSETLAVLELSETSFQEPTRSVPEEEQPFQWTSEDIEAL